MECSKIKQLLSAYIDNLLDEEKKALVEGHIKRCKSCAEELKSLRACINELGSMDKIKAPEDFLDLMRQQLQTRITYESYIPDIFLNNDKLTKTKQPVISTLPISVNAGLCDYNAIFSGDKRGIYVNHYRVPCCDYYGTVYYPDPITSIYRASLTGDLLIIESILPLEGHEKELFDVSASFGIYDYKFTDHIINDHYQVLGKISPMDESIRRDLILKMTVNNNLYSLGRFATWRNILLDDVLQDIFKIKELVNKDLYDKVRII